MNGVVKIGSASSATQAARKQSGGQTPPNPHPAWLAGSRLEHWAGAAAAAAAGEELLGGTCVGALLVCCFSSLV